MIIYSTFNRSNTYIFRFFRYTLVQLSYIFTFIFGSILIKKLNKKSLNNLSDIQIDKFFVWAVLGVIIGGRVGYVLFYQLQLFFLDPLYIFQIWKGGMSFHGV